MVRTFVSIAGLLFLLALCVEKANACTCQHQWRDSSPEAIRRAIDGSDRIFSAKVISVKRKPASLFSTVTLRVIRGWKGQSPGARVTTESGPTSMCAFPFTVGKEYLIYGLPSGPGKVSPGRSTKVSTSICSRTRLLSEASEDILVLNDSAAR